VFAKLCSAAQIFATFALAFAFVLAFGLARPLRPFRCTAGTVFAFAFAFGVPLVRSLAARFLGSDCAPPRGGWGIGRFLAATSFGPCFHSTVFVFERGSRGIVLVIGGAAACSAASAADATPSAAASRLLAPAVAELLIAT
jgi:hypothetical protein